MFSPLFLCASRKTHRQTVSASAVNLLRQKRKKRTLPETLDKGRQLDLAILDFSKAFDRVPHERLLKKLDHYGIRGKTLDWIRAFLTNRTQKVTVKGVVSESIHVKSGVPQGSVLGQILFLVFINDLPASAQSSSRLFADDCVVYREIRSDKDCQILQDDLQKLWEWEKLWGMSFHPEKCSILRVHRKRSPIMFSYSLKGHTLNCEESTKYLGVEICYDIKPVRKEEGKSYWKIPLCDDDATREK